LFLCSFVQELEQRRAELGSLRAVSDSLRSQLSLFLSQVCFYDTCPVARLVALICGQGAQFEGIAQDRERLAVALSRAETQIEVCPFSYVTLLLVLTVSQPVTVKRLASAAAAMQPVVR
jgi:hypothetical protein